MIIEGAQDIVDAGFDDLRKRHAVLMCGILPMI